LKGITPEKNYIGFQLYCPANEQNTWSDLPHNPIPKDYKMRHFDLPMKIHRPWNKALYSAEHPKGIKAVGYSAKNCRA